jgi:hypothetical protein
MLTTALGVVYRFHWGAAHRPSSRGRPAPVPAQAADGRAGELADRGQDPKFTEAQRAGVQPVGEQPKYPRTLAGSRRDALSPAAARQ